MIKKYYLSLILILLAIPSVYSAQNNAGYNNVAPPNISSQGMWNLLDKIISYLFGIFLAFAVIFFIIAAFNFITAQGEPEKVKRARDFVLWALIGVLVAFVSRGLIEFIKGLVGS